MKSLKSFKMLLLLMVAGVMFTACGSASEAEKVNQKIEKGEALAESDYTVMIDYMGQFAEKAQPIQDNINNLPAEDPKAAPYQEELDKLKESYPLLKTFTETLAKATPEQVGQENVALVDKYAGYEWFTAPDWATINTDPAIGGIELQAPNDSNGVVAGAVDELKVTE